MTNTVAKRIEEWFDDPVNEEGDFFRLRAVNWVTSPHAKTDRVIYCTKRHSCEEIFRDVIEPVDAGVICRAGLPFDDDVAWLHALIGDRKLLFFGDMDPADLMIFAWLRTKFSAAQHLHIGVNDKLAQRLDYVMPPAHRIELMASERAAIARIDEFVPDVQEILGPNGFDIWQSGFKIESEALFADVCNYAELFKVLTQA